jgi:hypothetical protein
VRTSHHRVPARYVDVVTLTRRAALRMAGIRCCSETCGRYRARLPPSAALALRPSREPARLTSPPPASTSAIRSNSWKKRSVPGEFDDIRQRLEAISEELADLAIARLRNPSTQA